MTKSSRFTMVGVSLADNKLDNDQRKEDKSLAKIVITNFKSS